MSRLLGGGLARVWPVWPARLGYQAAAGGSMVLAMPTIGFLGTTPWEKGTGSSPGFFLHCYREKHPGDLGRCCIPEIYGVGASQCKPSTFYFKEGMKNLKLPCVLAAKLLLTGK